MVYLDADDSHVRRPDADIVALAACSRLLGERLLDGVDAEDGDPVAGDDSVHQGPVHVQLHVTGHLAVGDRVGGLLELENLEVVAPHLVGHDEVGVEGALGLARLLAGRAVALAGQGVPLETGRDGDIGDHRPA